MVASLTPCRILSMLRNILPAKKDLDFVHQLISWWYISDILTFNACLMEKLKYIK
jgi:hypothetical protein